MNPPQVPWWVLPGLAVMVLSIFAGALVAACFIGNDTLLTTMFTCAANLGTLSAGYYFGSSAGSRRKDDVMAAAASASAANGKDDQPIAIAINTPKEGSP